MEEDLSDKRVNYTLGTLDEKMVKKNAIAQFKEWYDEASVTPGIVEPNAMILCTASKDGIPSGRPLLLKSFDEHGFVFYTNYDSRKSHDLKENPKAALVFYWEPLQRTIRIEGEVEKVPEDQSTHYFQSRPRDSQIGAWASPHQSEVVKDRDEIEQRKKDAEKKFEGVKELPKPEYWGGWRVKPLAIEFWQGRKCRLHDRLYFSRENTDQVEWKLQRLSP